MLRPKTTVTQEITDTQIAFILMRLNGLDQGFVWFGSQRYEFLWQDTRWEKYQVYDVGPVAWWRRLQIDEVEQVLCHIRSETRW